MKSPSEFALHVLDVNQMKPAARISQELHRIGSGMHDPKDVNLVIEAEVSFRRSSGRRTCPCRTAETRIRAYDKRTSTVFGERRAHPIETLVASRQVFSSKGSLCGIQAAPTYCNPRIFASRATSSIWSRHRQREMAGDCL